MRPLLPGLGCRGFWLPAPATVSMSCRIIQKMNGAALKIHQNLCVSQGFRFLPMPNLTKSWWFCEASLTCIWRAQCNFVPVPSAYYYDSKITRNFEKIILKKNNLKNMISTLKHINMKCLEKVIVAPSRLLVSWTL